MNAVAGCELHATRRPLYHATAGSPLSITRTGDDEEGRCCHAPSYADAVFLLRRVHRRRRWKVEKPLAETLPCRRIPHAVLPTPTSPRGFHHRLDRRRVVTPEERAIGLRSPLLFVGRSYVAVEDVSSPGAGSRASAVVRGGECTAVCLPNRSSILRIATITPRVPHRCRAMNAVAGCELHATRRPLYHATAGSPLSITRTGDDEEGRCCHAPSYADAVFLLRRVHRRRRWKVEKPLAETLPCRRIPHAVLPTPTSPRGFHHRLDRRRVVTPEERAIGLRSPLLFVGRSYVAVEDVSSPGAGSRASAVVRGGECTAVCLPNRSSILRIANAPYDFPRNSLRARRVENPVTP
nr:hypothetical protein Itr_chr06CG14280 [Ipomoea trifida]